VGSVFTVPTVRVSAPRDLEPWLALIKAQLGPFPMVGSSARADQSITEHDWAQPTVLVIGNETTGMSAHYKQRCDTIVNIPMAGAATSLNVACAASILLYEIQRQRRAHLSD
jgi:TrmH family RNA methyltransferase